MKRSELKKMIQEEVYKLNEGKNDTAEEMMQSISDEGLYAIFWYLKDWDSLIKNSDDDKEIAVLKSLKRTLPGVGKDLNYLYKKYYGDSLL